MPDPVGRPPLCGEAQFQELVQDLVEDEAPRLFAVVQEYGDRVDCRIAAWGMAFSDRVEVVSVRGGLRMKLSEPEDSLCWFRLDNFVSARLVWHVGLNGQRP
ncbi:hypothetical protein [Saccharopolyspora mangrovi]|uniref:Uncharacterized protein n=1 Tax=Saccharopolyspora mangrovi TaxID=3082379 RepID=A0ABU6AJN5_9PSEU|nr:hypothetical protein [Saccharopolyspora sp. S2-29]MEB3371594.1 hypothetical protein [Saccharopolyspora sp. S2-29]